MEITVLGAGVTGVTTAYFLAEAGNDVTVIDRDEAPGMGTSGSNAGFLAPNDSFAWAAPGAPIQLIKSLFKANTGLAVKPSLDPALYRWGLAFLAQCSTRRNIANSIAQLKIATYSQTIQLELAARLGLRFEQRQAGSFYLFRTQQELDAAFRHRRIFEEFGVQERLITMDEVVALEPSLGRVKTLFAGAIFGESDGSGDCAAFTRELAARAVATGRVRFLHNEDVLSLASDGDRISGVRLRDRTLRSDAYVLSLGTGSARVAATVGIKLPIYPVKGFAATIPVRPGGAIPERPGVDQTALVAWSSMGDRLRLCSSAQLAGYDTKWKPTDRSRLLGLGAEIFGDALDYEGARFRAALRPMTPAGPPLVGATSMSNLFLNTGHGHLGWTMASGTGRAVADLITERSYEASCITMKSA